MVPVPAASALSNGALQFKAASSGATIGRRKPEIQLALSGSELNIGVHLRIIYHV
jgi:hypothetical protein